MSASKPAVKRELSCLIGRLFATIEPPCAADCVGEITIVGTTHSGKKGTLVITGDAFFFNGNDADLIAATSQICDRKSGCALYRRGEGGVDG